MDTDTDTGAVAAGVLLRGVPRWTGAVAEGAGFTDSSAASGAGAGAISVRVLKTAPSAAGKTPPIRHGMAANTHQ